MQERLIFYTTAGCHLCEQAKTLYQSTLNPQFFFIEELDVASSDQLIADYGNRIPVLKRCLDNSELNWPFDQHELVAFLTE